MRTALAALVVLLVGIPTAAASGSSLTIDPPNAIPPVGDSLVLPLAIAWSFEGVVCKEAATARLHLFAAGGSGVSARLEPATIDVAIPATGARGANVGGEARTDLVLGALRAGQGEVVVTASLALPDACLALGGERRAHDELRLPLELRPDGSSHPPAVFPTSTASPRSESLLAAPDEGSRLRTIPLSDPWRVPGPVIMLLVAIVGTLLVEVGRRMLRAARRAHPAA